MSDRTLVNILFGTLLSFVIGFGVYIELVAIPKWQAECESVGLKLHLPQGKGDAYKCVRK